VKFEIDVNGRTRTVSIERAAEGRYTVLLDGEVRELDVVRSGVHGLSLIRHDLHLSHDVQVTPTGERGEMLVTLAGRVAQVSVNARQTRRAAADGGAGTQGDQAVTAPMPGRVVRVLVKAGDEVAARQGVVVVEAMKMENELRSPKAGRVKDISVAPGTSVEAGRVLLVIE
jgi:biotin carboxyl carrier protein